MKADQIIKNAKIYTADKNQPMAAALAVHSRCAARDVDIAALQKSLREGALDAYDTVMIRMRWTPTVSRDSRLQHDGVTYQIQSLHRDYQSNIVQITATEII